MPRASNDSADLVRRDRHADRIDRVVRGAARKAWLALRDGRLPLSPRWWAKAFALHRQQIRSAPPVSTRAGTMDRQALDESYRRWLRRYETRAADQPPAPPLDVVVLFGGNSEVSILGEPFQPPPLAWTLWLVCLDETAYSLAADASARQDRFRWKVVQVTACASPDGSWLPPGDCSHVVLVDGRMTPALGTLERVIPGVIEGNADWTYTDDDCLVDGLAKDPYLKGESNLALLAVDDYAARVVVVRRAAIERLGGFRKEYADAQLYELCLRMSHQPAGLQHIAAVCGHRTVTVETPLGTHHCTAATHELFGTERVSTVRVDDGQGQQPIPTVVWSPSQANEAVTIVIPTRDRIDLLQSCIESVRRTVGPLVQILVVDDHSVDSETHAYLARLGSDERQHCRVTRPSTARTGFNYAALMNHGARYVTTPLMLHLNNDVEAISPGWLEQMVGWFSVPEIGAVGARLVYPDGSIQHAGVVVSPADGAPTHFQHGLAASDRGYQGWPNKVRDVSAVTGACLLTRTTLFANVGGFDHEHFSVQFNDIDYCLRLRQAGHRIVYEPAATLIHRGSASRGQRYDSAETLYFLTKYRNYTDPFVSPLLNPLSLGGTTPIVRA